MPNAEEIFSAQLSPIQESDSMDLGDRDAYVSGF